jgi:hypothetical protein
VDERGLPPLPPVHPPRKTGKRLSIAIAIIAIVGIGVLIGLLESGGGKKTPTANASPAANSSTVGVVTSGGLATPTVSSSVALPSDPIAPATRPAGKPVAAAPATKTVHVTPTSPHASTTPSFTCHPVRPIFDTCYLVGQNCPAADHGVSGVSIDGEPMTCAQENGNWLWRAS